MTEQEWLTSEDSGRMLQHLEYHYGYYDRKMRLFACACCQQIWDRMTDSRSRNAVQIAERFADGQASQEDLITARDAAWAAVRDSTWGPRRNAASDAAWAASRDAEWGARNAATKAQAHILREIVGNPFKPVAFRRHWKTLSSLQLAQTIYDTRDFFAMPILGDALEEAGCDNEDILTHCRGDNIHVRGCWVVDLILGKE